MKDALASSVTMLAIAWRTSRTKILVAVLLTLLFGTAWPLVALTLKAGTDAVVAADTRGATIAGVLLGVGAIGALILQHFAFVPYAEVTERAVVSLEEELIELANGSAGLEHHERPEYADRVSIVQREVSQFTEGMIGLMTTLSLVTSMSITAVLLAFLNPWLLLLPIAALPPVIAANRAQKVISRAKDAAAPTTRQCDHLYRLATTAASAKELRVLRLQSELSRRHARLWAQAGGVLWRAERRAVVINAAGQLVFAVAYVVAVLLVIRQAVAGRSQVGDVVLVLVLAGQVNQQVNAGLELLRRLQRMAEGLTRLRALRALIAERRPPPPDTPMPGRIHDGIELRGVDFDYPGTGRPVLAGVDLKLPSGSTVAIVGENGAGKTTLVKLLCRFYDTTRGTITLDGVDIRRFPLDDWRGHIAAGFQDFVRFELRAGQTVGAGDLPHIDDDEAVLSALQRARAVDIVDRLDDGLRTQLGKTWTEGTELSGGQWQKLALGRALMRERPLLLILDEPTSALDAEAEHRLFERYADNARRVGRATGAITVLVSHRFSTVRMADLILVVADGRIAESGDHAALMARGGLYAELYTLQAAAYTDTTRR